MSGRYDILMMMAAQRFALVAASLAFLPLACGTYDGQSVGRQQATHADHTDVRGTNLVAPGPAVSAGHLRTARYYRGLQISLLPPPKSTLARVSWQAAYQTCWTTAPCIADQNPEIVLALFTDGSYGQIQPDGSAIFPYQGVLAYALTWANMTCVSSGPAGAPHSSEVCDTVVFVDANTGEVVIGVQSPHYTAS